jgi:D-psicose/D-tagatose/L-ribulose 3-epimerase
MVKFGVNACLWTMPFTTEDIGLIDRAKRLGFDVLEIPVLSRDPFEVETVTAAFRRAKVEPVVMAVMAEDRDLVHPDPTIRENGRDYLRYCVGLANRMGASLVEGPICSAPGRYWVATDEQKKKDFHLCAAALGDVAAYAAANGVVLSMKLLNRYETSFMNQVEEACALVDAVESPALGIGLDTFHLNIEEKRLGPAIEVAGERLVHFHASENDRGTPGTGHIPWGEVAAALKTIAYPHRISIVSFIPNTEMWAKALFVWRSFAPDMDLLASEGLAFVEALMA